MKIKDVPQELPFYERLTFRDIVYAIDENGEYAPVISDGWDIKNDAVKIAHDDLVEQCEELRRQAIAKEISPLAYHMKKALQDVALLSAYSGIPKRKIRKHLKYDEFMKLDEKTLYKYAYAMRITVEELKSVNDENKL